MSEVQYRSFQPDLELRKGGDGRTVYGIAVPYRKPMQITEGLIEQFGPDPFPDQVRAYHRIPFAREHLPLGGSLIGATRLLRNDAAGLYGEWHISRTPLGDETLELFKDGALRDLSIGFRERVNRSLQNGIVERVRATLTEVAMTLEGAYGELAMAHGVRSARPVEPPPRPNLAIAAQLAAELKPLAP